MLFETPYVREPMPPSLHLGGVPRKYMNYTDFDIFALTKNLYPYIQDIRENLIIEVFDDDYDKLFPEEEKMPENENRSRYYVKITDSEGDDPSLNLDEEEKVMQAIEEVCSHSHGRYLVFMMSYQHEVYSKQGKKIPVAWLNTMMPYAPLGNLKPIFHVKRGMYVILEPIKDYEGIYGRMYEKIISWFQNEYQLAVVPAIFTSKFIEDWDLVQDRQFFRPRRINPLVMGDDPVEFFTNKIFISGENYIWVSPCFTEDEIYFIENLLRRKRYEYVEERGRFHIKVSGYQETKNLSSQMLASLDIDINKFEDFKHELSLCRV